MLRLSAALLLAIAAPAAAMTEPSPYPALAALEARVATIGYRLTTGNAPWCARVQPQFGWLWGDPRLYSDAQRPAAEAAYGAASTDTPFLAAVAAGSPAAAAGLHAGSLVQGLPGSAPPQGEGSDPYARIAALERLFAGLPSDRPTMLDTGKAPVRIVPVVGCATDFRVDARDRPDGAADGRLVVISAGLAQFAKDDAELATAIAHELAHNILGHRARLDAAGVDRGLLQQFGRNARLFKQTEIEADRLSPWLMANAGYDPRAAVRFWTAFGQRAGRPLLQAGTHPRWQDRAASIEKEVRAIEAQRAAGQPLAPPLIGAPPPLE
ncbi:M48 family metallopeptidase [Sphingopyxis terrae]|uniref:Peptidase M48 domain-containing protein n=1 Tax=Sphingopyxis terrae subsp. ummariensis TaxID=429001 RepID=A0A1Y6ET93_9SPHN|nr:M48 family metallopeptidase [Sphingopyxis terrae]PCF92077.1 peptidase M48, Ste24p [Sphingopyxis terrae subsp. ummariensis]SMQ65439.1 hypothetical protein SAMN06295984_1263 [Sphingopyxis terrae subsp. ummariensis]